MPAVIKKVIQIKKKKINNIKINIKNKNEEGDHLVREPIFFFF